MSKYKMVAIDLDGTLLGWHGTLTEENYRAISALADRGVIFVPTTGRALSEVPDELLRHPAVRYVITTSAVISPALYAVTCSADRIYF